MMRTLWQSTMAESLFIIEAVAAIGSTLWRSSLRTAFAFFATDLLMTLVSA